MSARIPTTGGRSVVPQPLRLPSATPASFGAGDAAALQDLGAGLGDLAEALLRNQERARKASARNNLVKLQSELTNALHEENGFLNRQPVDGQNVFAEYQSGIAADQQKFIDAIPDPLEREILQANWDRLNSTASGQVLRAEGANVRALDKQTLLAHSGTETDAWVAGETTPEEDTEFRAFIKANTANFFSADAGISLEGQTLKDFNTLVDRETDKAIFSAYAKKVRAINARSPERALLYAKENFKFLPPATRDELVEDLKELTIVDKAHDIVTGLIRSNRSRAEQNADINAIKDSKLRAAVKKAIDRRRAEIKAVAQKGNESMFEAEYSRLRNGGSLAELNRNLKPNQQEQLISWYSPGTKITKTQRQVSQIALYKFMNQARITTPGVQLGDPTPVVGIDDDFLTDPGSPPVISRKSPQQLFAEMDLVQFIPLFTPTDWKTVTKLQFDTREMLEGKKHNSILSVNQAISSVLNTLGIDDDKSAEAITYTGLYWARLNEKVDAGLIQTDQIDDPDVLIDIANELTQMARTSSGPQPLIQAIHEETIFPGKQFEIRGPVGQDNYPISVEYLDRVKPFEHRVDGTRRFGWAFWERPDSVILWEIGGPPEGTRLTLRPGDVSELTSELDQDVINRSIAIFSGAVGLFPVGGIK